MMILRKTGLTVLNDMHGEDGRDETLALEQTSSASDGLQSAVSGSSEENRDESGSVQCKRIRLMDTKQDNETPLCLSGKFTPLGLTLRKTPSFLDLLEMKLSKAAEKTSPVNSEKSKVRCDDPGSQPTSERLKASNFSVSFLKIGSWERVCRYEGDLVAKCYYAKRKLVWEVLHSGLKSKIEFQWSDISAIRATCSESEPGVLEIELNHPPLFFRETNPQPRKHTLWQATSDFTGCQATLCRRHYLRFPEGTLQKHYERLLQCDDRLHSLSQKPFPTVHSPYFHLSHGGFQDFCYDRNIQVLKSIRGFNCNFKDSSLLRVSRHGNGRSCMVPNQQVPNFEVLRPKVSFNGLNSPCSVIDFPPIENHGTREHVEHQNIFYGDGIEHQESIGNRCEAQLRHQIAPILPQQVSSKLQSSNAQIQSSPHNLELNRIAEQLFGESSTYMYSDEQKILARVNSMQSLLAASETNAEVNSTDIGQEEYALEKSADGSTAAKSFDTELTDNELVVGLPDEQYNESLLSHLPQSTSFPYLFSDRTSDDFVNETECNQWR